MTSFSPIGGYFGLESSSSKGSPSSGINFNCARNCLRYLVQLLEIKKIHFPFYTCPSLLKVLEKENCQIDFYHIDENFMPLKDFPKNDFVLYTNYFGICAKNVKLLASQHEKLIVDNAQAFYMPHYGFASFNSLRKFFGVPDGARLLSSKDFENNYQIDISYDRCSHLLKRIDVSAQFGYDDFCKNETYFENSDIKFMSNLSSAIFAQINLQQVKQIRLENFSFLKNELPNVFDWNLDFDDVPLAFPFYTEDLKLQEKLIANKIFVPKYWSNIDYQCLNKEEIKMINNFLYLPIDQRYNKLDMQRIIEVING